MNPAQTVRSRLGRLAVAVAALAVALIAVAACSTSSPSGKDDADNPPADTSTGPAPSAQDCGSGPAPAPTPGSGGGVITKPCASTSAPANNELPADFVGTWNSDGFVDQTPAASEYTATLTLRPGAVGSVVGEVDYPELGCSGELTLEAAAADSVSVTELITDDPQARCVVQGTIELTPVDGSGDRLAFAYTRDGESSITATVELVAA